MCGERNVIGIYECFQVGEGRPPDVWEWSFWVPPLPVGLDLFGAPSISMD